MVTMAGKAFVDTNVLLRAINRAMPLHQQAKALIEQMWDDGVELWISRQVIREYVAQVTRPQLDKPPLSVEQVMTQVDMLQSLFSVADETLQTTIKLMDLLKEFPTGGKQIHDANIVATMLVYDIDSLLTQNIEDMKRFASKIKILPLSDIMN